MSTSLRSSSLLVLHVGHPCIRHNEVEERFPGHINRGSTARSLRSHFYHGSVTYSTAEFFMPTQRCGQPDSLIFIWYQLILNGF